MQEHSKKIQELSNFLLDYATTLMAVGSHTSRIVKNVTRIAESFGFGVDMTHFSAQHHHDRQTFRRLLHPTNLRPTDSSNGFKLPYNIRPECPELGSL